MTSVKNRERILEAIDQLRKRKARPDIQRICNYLFRRYSVNSAEARSDLDWCVANNYVLKVEYKGNISYRNAAKKIAQMKQRGDPSRRTQQNNKIHQADNAIDNGSVKQMKQFGELLTNAFGELIVEEPDYLETGIPSAEIIENILTKDSVRYTKKYISLLIDKEVARGGLIKMENGNYLMGPAKNDEEPDSAERDRKTMWLKGRNEIETEIDNSELMVPELEEGENNRSDLDFSDNKLKKKIMSDQKKFFKTANFENMDRLSADHKKFDNGSLRIGGRRKRAKKVFDPSDNHIPKKRGRPIGSLNRSTIEKQLAKLNAEEARPDSRTSTSSRDQGGVCSVCHIQNKRGPNDRMVSCRECSNKAHLSCLNGDDNMMLKMYPDNTWQCPHCKTCVVCFETSNSGTLTICSVCADAYHSGCHQPRLSDKIRNGQKWTCGNCQMPDDLKINEIHSNIGNSFSHKITIGTSLSINSGFNACGSRNSSSSNSGNTSSSNSLSQSPTPPRLSPQLIESRSNEYPDGGDQSDSTSDYDDNIDPSIPDATHWTADEVYQYFAQYFPEEAKIFKEQEIDGRSLLLLKRMDVLTNLNLKLGPALKIYRHVVKLQVRRDDPKLYWL